MFLGVLGSEHKRYTAAVMAKNGLIYAPPCSAERVLEIDAGLCSMYLSFFETDRGILDTVIMPRCFQRAVMKAT